MLGLHDVFHISQLRRFVPHPFQPVELEIHLFDVSALEYRSDTLIIQ